MTNGPAPRLVMVGVPSELARILVNFDDLDFRIYTTQQWQDLHKSRTKDVVLHWPDGHTTKGIEKHIGGLKVMSTLDGEWTAVTGWLEEKFTKPMLLPNGKTEQPTGKAYAFPWRRSAIGIRKALCSRSSFYGTMALS